MSAERSTENLARCHRRLTDFGLPEVSTRAKERKARREEKAAKAPAASTSRHAPRSLGKLQVFIGMPLDILAEIASHLTPLDLLHLSRVSRQFHTVLASRTARHMWAAARANFDGLPDCPVDLTEAAYARLLFENECDACGLTPARITCYQMRIRMCKPCYQLNVKKGTALCKMLAPSKEHPNTFSLMPSASDYSNYLDVNMEWEYYYKPEYIWVTEQYVELLRGGDQSALAQFVTLRKQVVSQLRESGIQLRRWESHHQNQKAQDGFRASCKRHDAIIARLRDLSYSYEDFPTYDAEWQDICYQPRPLTDRSWKSVEPKLIGIIKRAKTERDQEQFEKDLRMRESETWALLPAWVSRHGSDSDRIFVPPHRNRGPLESLGPLLQEARATIPVTVERLDSIGHMLLAELGLYRLRVKQHLVGLLNKPSDSAESPFKGYLPLSHEDTPLDEAECDSILERASSLFGSDLCGDHIMDYRELLSHHDHVPRNVSIYLPSHATSTPSFFARWVLQHSGLSQYITSDDIIGLSGRFSCLCGVSGTKAVSFVELVRHLMKKNHLYHYIDNYQSVDYPYTSVYSFHGGENRAPCVPLLAKGETIPTSQGDIQYPEGTFCIHCYAIHPPFCDRHILQDSIEAGLHMKYVHRLDTWDEQDVSTQAGADERVAMFKRRAVQHDTFH